MNNYTLQYMIIKYLTLATILITNVSFAFSQVTIGLSEKPAEGALLQLKNIPDIADGSANSTKGLGLPRVNLVSASSTQPLSDNITDNANLIGTLVYNVNTKCSNVYWKKSEPIIFSQGMMVWNGEFWNPLMKKELADGVGSLTDIDGNIYTTMDYGTAGVWMTENLRVKQYDTESEVYAHNPTYVNLMKNYTGGWKGTLVEPTWSYPGRPGIDDGLSTYLFDLDPSIGLMYNLPATLGKSGQINGIGTDWQGICPNGWRVPRWADYANLMNNINADPSKYSTDTKSGVENLVSDCDIVQLPNSILDRGRSLKSYEGGFSLKMYAALDKYISQTYLAYNFGIVPIGGNPNYPALWTTNGYNAKYQCTASVDYVTSTLRPLWITYSSTQTAVRCLKK